MSHSGEGLSASRALSGKTVTATGQSGCTTNSTGWCTWSGVVDGTYTIQVLDPTQNAVMNSTTATISGNTTTKTLNNAFYYDSFPTFTKRKLGYTIHMGEFVNRWSVSNVSGFFNDIMYRKPYFQAVTFVFDGPEGGNTYLSTQINLIKAIAVRADVENLDILISVGSYVNNVRKLMHDSNYHNRLDIELNTLGNHSSIKNILWWTEFSNATGLSRAQQISALNNLTRIAEKHNSRGGIYRTVVTSGNQLSIADEGMYDFIWHVNYPDASDAESIIEIGGSTILTSSSYRGAGVFGVGVGLWTYLVWSKHNVERVYSRATTNPTVNDFAYVFWHSCTSPCINDKMVLDNGTIRQWIYDYFVNATYKDKFTIMNKVANIFDSTNKTWVATNGTLTSVSNTTGRITIQASGSTSQKVWFFLYAPSGKVLQNIVNNGTTITANATTTFANGDKLYNVTLTMASSEQVIFNFNTFSLSDSLTVSDSIQRLLVLGRTLSDTLTLSDSLITIRQVLYSLSESLEVIFSLSASASSPSSSGGFSITPKQLQPLIKIPLLIKQIDKDDRIIFLYLIWTVIIVAISSLTAYIVKNRKSLEFKGFDF